MTKEQKEKTKFRASAKWKKFTKSLKKEQKTDAITGKPLYKGCNCHHLDQRFENYKNLDKQRFRMLNRKSHDFIHWLYLYWIKEPEILNRIEKLLIEMKAYSED